MPEAKEQVVQRLENVVRKAKVFCQGADDVGCRIHPPQGHGHPFLIEVHEDRYSKRVSVDPSVVQNLNVGQPDPGLLRELRTAIMAVHRLAGRGRRD